MKVKTIYTFLLMIILFSCLIYGCVKSQDNFDKWAKACDEEKGRECNYAEVENYARTH